MSDDLITAAKSFSSDQVKHLEFIQATINRISGNSFLIKGWTLTIASSLLAFSVSNSNWQIALISLIPVVAFWLLDGYFLFQERLFRALYDEARTPGSTLEPFAMDLTQYRQRAGYLHAARSVTLIAFYGGLLTAQILVIGITATS
ncbi:hypothetical protein [Nonomuraea aridisoli]|uniref:hypothetical protein n=1 Tax=Nonomuraea aridisoli TaxID=2070368 RepID=UPI0011B9446A|nr:hypothetical protein [Nonomuraea aridisoli]